MIFVVNSIDVTFENDKFDLAIFADRSPPIEQWPFRQVRKLPAMYVVRHQKMASANHAALEYLGISP